MTRPFCPTSAPPVGARLVRLAACLLCQAAARLDRMAMALERTEPSEEERCYTRALIATYGKLD